MAAAEAVILPEEYTLRHARDQDIPAIIALLAATDSALGQEKPMVETPDDIRRDWQGLDMERDTWAITARDGALAAYATLSDEGEGLFTADGYVSPNHWRRGLGTALLRLTEARARERMNDAPTGARVALLNSIVQEDEAAGAILAAHGFTLARVFWRMRIDMTEPPPPPEWPAGFHLRTLAPGHDERAVFETVEAAFADHWGHTPTEYDEWITRTQRGDHDPSLWFLVETDTGEATPDAEGKTLAAVALCRDRDDQGWINTVATLRAYRKRGLARALLLHSFGEFWRRGQQSVGLGVDAQSLTGAAKLYEGVGMRPIMRILTFEKELRAGDDRITRALDG